MYHDFLNCIIIQLYLWNKITKFGEFRLINVGVRIKTTYYSWTSSGKFLNYIDNMTQLFVILSVRLSVLTWENNTPDSNNFTKL